MAAIVMFASSPALPEPPRGSNFVLQLRQIAYGDRLYFFHGDAMAFSLRARPKRKKFDLETFDLVSNVVVYVERTGRPEDVDTRAMVDKWIDARGRTHSLELLQKQIDFNIALEKRRSEQERRFGARARGRIPPLNIAPVLETGILDQRTLLIPYMQLALRCEEIELRFWLECDRAQNISCGGGPLPNEFLKYWRPRIESAEQALAAFERRLLSIPLERYPSGASIDDWDRFAKGDVYAGLKEVPLPEGVGQNLSWRRPNLPPVWLLPTQDEPERQVQESVPDGALDASTFQSFASAEAAASGAIADAERMGRDMFPGNR